MSFDIVIPLGPNESGKIADQIYNIRKQVEGFRNIYIVSYDPSIQIEGCTTFDEKIFPFTFESISELFK